MSELPAKSEETAQDRLARLQFNAIPDSEPEETEAQPQRRQCTGISRSTGERCTAWAAKGHDQCPGHAGLVSVDPAAGLEARRKASEERRLARMSVRDRLAHELDQDQDALISALKDGIRLSDRKAASQAAIRYVQLIYGTQLQRAEDERPSHDPLDIGSMTRAEREELKRKLLADHPELAERLRLVS